MSLGRPFEHVITVEKTYWEHQLYAFTGKWFIIIMVIMMIIGVNLNSINMSYAIHIFLENDYDVICGVIMMSARGHFSLKCMCSVDL